MERGKLTDEIQEKAKSFLGREIDQTELRLYPFVDYCIKNFGEIDDPRKINGDDRLILKRLNDEGHIYFHSLKIELTKDFYDFIQDILWLSYVPYKLEEE